MGEDESNYPITLSDWINFLMNIINNYEKKFGDNTTRIFTIAAIVFSIFSLSLSIISLAVVFAEHGITINITSVSNMLTGIAVALSLTSIILVLVSSYQIMSKKSRYVKANDLLSKIMKGEIIDPIKVRDKWFTEEEKKMSFWKSLSYGILGLSFIFAIISLFGFEIARNSAIIILPIGIAIYALAQSEDMEKKLTQIGNDSNNKLKTIGNAIFMEIVDIFEDKRIQLVQHPDWLGIDVTIWKCKTYVNRAINLKESTEIDKTNQTTLFNWYHKLIYESGLPWDTKTIVVQKATKKDNKIVIEEFFDTLKKVDIQNMIDMGEKLKKLDLDSNDMENLKKDLEFIRKNSG